LSEFESILSTISITLNCEVVISTREIHKTLKASTVSIGESDDAGAGATGATGCAALAKELLVSGFVTTLRLCC
jgi:hypothetical protein